MHWIALHNPFSSAGGTALVLAVVITAIYLGWRNLRRSKGAPAIPSDRWVIRFAIALLVAVCVFVITK
jgi:hypothetical protein